MNARIAIFALIAIGTLLPAAPWHRRHLPSVPTHVPSDAHVARCQRLAAHWTPANSNPSLRAWVRCMRLRP